MKQCPHLLPANPQYRDPPTRQVMIQGEPCVEIGAGKWLELMRDLRYWAEMGRKK